MSPTDKICDIIRDNPGIEKVFLSVGMDCLNCSSLSFDTVADGCEIHRQDLGFVLSLLNRFVEQK